MLFLRLPAVLLSALASVLIAGTALAADLPALVGSLTTGSFGDRETAVGALATSGEPAPRPFSRPWPRASSMSASPTSSCSSASPTATSSP